MNILDLLSSKGISPRKVAGTKGGEYHSPCPKCGGRDRFHCWPAQRDGGDWWCRGCGKSGDLIQFLIHVDGLSYPQACERLGIQRKMNSYRSLPSAPRLTAAPEAFTGAARELPPALWSEKAGELVTKGQEELPKQVEVVEWLAKRGIFAGAIQRFGLGWIKGDDKNGCYYRHRPSWGLPEGKKLWIPRGLLIPTIRREGIVGLRIRLPEAFRKKIGFDNPYYVLPGSAALPLVGNVLPSKAPRYWVIVESQLDAIMLADILAAKMAPGVCGVMATLSNTGKPCPKSHRLLTLSAKILVALDYDEAGKKGADWWLKTYPQAVRWPVLEGKDPGEAFAAGVDMVDWVMAALPNPTQTPETGQPGTSSSGADSMKGGAMAPAKTPVPKCSRLYVDFKALKESISSGVYSSPTVMCNVLHGGKSVGVLGTCLDCPSRPRGLFELFLGMSEKEFWARESNRLSGGNHAA